MAFDPTCPDCRAKMDRGFVPDAAGGPVLESQWHPGQPQERKILGMSSGMQIEPDNLIPIVAWRCGRCGLLRFFASQPDPGFDAC